MAPSAGIQARIQALETAANEKHGFGYPPADLLAHENDSLDVISLGSPTSESMASLQGTTPNGLPTPSRSPSPAILGRKTSLIDLSESFPPPLPARPPSDSSSARSIPFSTPQSTGGPFPSMRHVSDSSVVIIDTHPKSQLTAQPESQRPSSPTLRAPPPLPNRKPTSSPIPQHPSTQPPSLPKRVTSSPGPTSSHSLSAAGHTYPPLKPPSRHAHAPSASSFHSVSLSDNGEEESSIPNPERLTSDKGALNKPIIEPPAQLTSPSVQQSQSRRAAPPPPPRKHAAPAHPEFITPNVKPVATHRRTPVPPAAKKRYDILFDMNINTGKQNGKLSSSTASSRSRTNSGWRGLSVDETHNPTLGKSKSSAEFSASGKDDQRIDGLMVKTIWSCSKLERDVLRTIWNECDNEKLGSLDRDSFAVGMWRIDEELKKNAAKLNDTRRRRNIL